MYFFNLFLYVLLEPLSSSQFSSSVSDGSRLRVAYQVNTIQHTFMLKFLR